ncbi:hypothetical protein Leryth_011475 [Lithospermum erythrorhizon]|nr:hypothetical protein Leryth_011475 [Lithospermum erythrorhizon]
MAPFDLSRPMFPKNPESLFRPLDMAPAFSAIPVLVDFFHTNFLAGSGIKLQQKRWLDFFLICKDKDEAEVCPRTYTRRSSPVNSPFGSGDNLHKFIGATMGMAELNIQNENGHIAMPRRCKLAFKVVVRLALDICTRPEGYNLPYLVQSINVLAIYLRYILNGYELVYQGEGDIDNLIFV